MLNNLQQASGQEKRGRIVKINIYPACLANINIIIMKMQNQSRDGSMYLRMVKVKKNAKSEVYIHHALQMIDIKVRKCRKIKTQHVLCNSKYDQRGKCQKYVQQVKVIIIETHNSDFLQYPVQTCFMLKPIVKLQFKWPFLSI